MGEAGANQFLLNLAGYKLKPVEQAPTNPPLTALEYAKLFVAAEEAKQALQAQIEADKGKVLLGGIIESAEGDGTNLTMSQFAQLVKIGRTTLFRMLREMKVIQKDNTLPYQWMIDKGYARVSEKVSVNKVGTRIDPFTLITPKGQTYLVKRLDGYKLREEVEVVMEGVLAGVAGF
jgi:phage antirepressor YoqD-like protein